MRQRDAISGRSCNEDANIKHANIMQFNSIINSIRKYYQWMSYLFARMKIKCWNLQRSADVFAGSIRNASNCFRIVCFVELIKMYSIRRSLCHCFEYQMHSIRAANRTMKESWSEAEYSEMRAALTQHKIAI